jgi:diguanylate cyclase
MIGEPLAMAEEGALLYARIGVLLSEHRLEPSPDNYALCHRYVTAGDSDFNERVERAIAEHGGLTSVAVAALVAQRNAEHSASDRRLRPELSGKDRADTRAVRR